MKVKHAMTLELVNNLSAKQRHPNMHKTIVCRNDMTPTCIKTIVCRFDVNTRVPAGISSLLVANQNRDSISIV